MSIEQVKAFMEEVKINKALQNKFAELQTDDIDSAIIQGLKIASDVGFEFSKEDFRAYNTQVIKETELVDSDLEQVAGGANPYTIEAKGLSITSPCS